MLRTAFLVYSIYTSAVRWRRVISKHRASPGRTQSHRPREFWLRALTHAVYNAERWTAWLLDMLECYQARHLLTTIESSVKLNFVQLMEQCHAGYLSDSAHDLKNGQMHVGEHCKQYMLCWLWIKFKAILMLLLPQMILFTNKTCVPFTCAFLLYNTQCVFWFVPNWNCQFKIIWAVWNCTFFIFVDFLW